MPEKNMLELLSPEILAKIENYHLAARIIVEGFIAGMHRSVYHGFGSEFLQYRNYSTGDDLKYVDWKVFGRLDRFYSKVFQEETNFNCTLVIDSSASMNYQGTSSKFSKFRYAAMLASSIAYLASKQGDNVGLFAYSDIIKNCVPPGNRFGHLHRVITEISKIKPLGKACHASNLNYISGALGKRGLIVLISDFLESVEDIQASMKNLRISRNDCIVIQILDKDELYFRFMGSINFIDSETNEHILTAPENIRKEYIDRLNSHIECLKKACFNAQCDFISVDTSKNPGYILAEYLHRRGNVY